MENACKCYQVRRAGFRYPAQTRVPYPVQTRSVGTIAATTTCCLRTIQQHCVVPGTVHCCCCIMCHMKIEATEKCRASRSDLQQQQRSSIMMHPSGDPAARRQRCSHATIPPRQPRSVCTSTWSLSRARYVRECCVLSLSVMRVENVSSYDHFIQQITFQRKKNVWN